MITLIAMGSFFAFWRIKALQMLDKAHKDNLEKNKQLEELNAIATQAAHDIRSPVMALESVTSSIENMEAARLRIIIHATRRINEIADNLISEYRKKFSTQITYSTLEKNSETLNSILSNTREEKILTVNQKLNIQIQGSSHYQLRDQAFAAELKRILSNLINNAIEAINTNGKIDIILTEFNHQILIEIRDDGKGIPKEAQSQIFERGTTNKVYGAGLGLFHAKEVIEKYGGKIQLVSNVGQGTAISLIFPKI